LWPSWKLVEETLVCPGLLVDNHCASLILRHR